MKLLQAPLAVLGVMAVFSADAAVVRQVFQPEVPMVGVWRPEQPIDAAAWIWAEGLPDVRPVFVRFMCPFEAADGVLRLHVSADERFALYLDGERIAAGPACGLVTRWNYQSYEISGLASGRHVLSAVVWALGDSAPTAQRSFRPGFVLRAEGAYDGRLTTGRGAWRCADVTRGLATDGHGTSGAFGSPRQFILAGTSPFAEETTVTGAVRIVRGPQQGRSSFGTIVPGWTLMPVTLKDQLHRPLAAGRFVAGAPRPPEGLRLAAADAEFPACAAFQRLKDRGEALTVPPRTELTVLLDLENYQCAFPELEVSGGRGAVVGWGWTEALTAGGDGRAAFLGMGVIGTAGVDDKGDRRTFAGTGPERMITDRLLCDGREKALFALPWWRSGRWCAISVKTADEPLKLTRLALFESRYPLESAASFACDDPELERVWALCLRGLQMCAHEILMDCPYYEQQQYPADVALIGRGLLAATDDPRPLRAALTTFDAARRADGMLPMNCPCRVWQDSGTQTMSGVWLLRDLMMRYGVDGWLRARLPGLRHTVEGLSAYENGDGLVVDLPGSSFLDWVPTWLYGQPPDYDGGPGRPSGVINLCWLQTLQAAAQIERAVGDELMARRHEEHAARLRAAIRAAFRSSDTGLVHDDTRFRSFGGHSLALSVLTGVATPDEAPSFLNALDGAGAEAATFFLPFVSEACARYGRGDLVAKRFDIWRTCLEKGMSTPIEAPTFPRSDCHGWAASALGMLLGDVVGVRPSAPGYAAVRVAPNPGPLKTVRASVPTPNGPVSVSLVFADGGAKGAVTLPAGTKGVFAFGGRETVLTEGVNHVER